ncbi:MAG TPA: carbonic anhydrase [Candidatus Binataceae bacterium]
MLRKPLAIATIVSIATMAMMTALSATAVRAAAPAAAARVDAKQALRLLLEGNERFRASKMEHPLQTPARREELVKGQHPLAAILACSDSRTPPEILFDRGLGDLFVARVAGNVADQVVIETLDYAVTHLGVRLIMILGHTRCGAVIAAVLGHDEPGDVGPMLSELKPAVAAAKKMQGDQVDNTVRENVKLVVQNLSQSAELSAMVNSGELKIVGGIYDLESGKIKLLED